jgi:endonuclease III-like uncharacterized protein
MQIGNYHPDKYSTVFPIFLIQRRQETKWKMVEKRLRDLAKIQMLIKDHICLDLPLYFAGT